MKINSNTKNHIGNLNKTQTRWLHDRRITIDERANYFPSNTIPIIVRNNNLHVYVSCINDVFYVLYPHPCASCNTTDA